MPMPTEGDWPPKEWGPAYRMYRDWDAWLVGSPDKLLAVLAGRGSGNSSIRPSLRTRPGQYAGGVYGALTRFFWGAPPPIDQSDNRKHCPLPADLAMVQARRLFGEPATLSAEKDDKQTQAVYDRLIEDGLNRKLLHGQIANSALGDIYLRPVIDKDAYPDRAITTVVHADGAIPVIRWDKLIEVTFWTCLQDDGSTYLRLLEHHDVVDGAGRITYALFKGTSDKLGQRVPLTEHRQAAYLAAGVEKDGTQPTGLDRLDVVRVPNSGPNFAWRTDPTLKYLGRSDFDQLEHWFDAVDEVWTSLMRDFRLAKARILVPDYMMRSNGPGQGATFDADQEIFRQLNMMPDPKNSGGQGITEIQFDIRVEQHIAGINEITKLVLRHDGLDASTFGDKEGPEQPVTATEVDAKTTMSDSTRSERIQTWKPALAEYVELHMALEQKAFGGPEPKRPTVNFGKGVKDSPEANARTIQLLDAAGAISLDLKVRMAHPDWDEPDILEEIGRLKTEKAEEQAAMAEPDTFNGDFGGGGKSGEE